MLNDSDSETVMHVADKVVHRQQQVQLRFAGADSRSRIHHHTRVEDWDCSKSVRVVKVRQECGYERQKTVQVRKQRPVQGLGKAWEERGAQRSVASSVSFVAFATGAGAMTDYSSCAGTI